MEYSTLGHTGIKVSPIGLGCMGMSHAYGDPKDKEEMIKLIRHAFEIGCKFFDTAPVYGFDNERILGEAVKPFRSQVIIGTKFKITGQKVVNGTPVNMLDSRPETILRDLDASLERLQTDYIDLYYQHRVDPNVEPEVVANVMKQLIESGKIRAWGVSNAPIDYIRRAHKVCPIAAMQNQYSLIFRSPEKDYIPLCEELGITYVAYGPVGSGFLSGRFTKSSTYEKSDFRSTMKRFRDEAMDKNTKVLDAIKGLAQAKGCTTAQIALAWALAQKPFIVPIPGTTSIARVEENMGSLNIKFTKEEMDNLNEALSHIEIDESYF